MTMHKQISILWTNKCNTVLPSESSLLTGPYYIMQTLYAVPLTCWMVWLIASLSLVEEAISCSALLLLATENASHWSGLTILQHIHTYSMYVHMYVYHMYIHVCTISTSTTFTRLCVCMCVCMMCMNNIQISAMCTICCNDLTLSLS